MYRDRTAVGAGGTIYFQGYFDDPIRVSRDGMETIQYLIHDVLWLFERNPFKQHRNQFNGWTVPGDPTTAPTVIDKVCPEIFLGEKLDGSLMKASEEITEVINWMNESYNPTRRGAGSGMDASKDVVAAGTINPAQRIPKERANTIFCIEAANRVMRWFPDAVYKIDHATTPPTLHVLTMGKWNYGSDPPAFIDYTNLPEVTIIITPDQEKEISMQTQASRQLPGVIIYYLSTATVDSLTVPVVIRDEYPVPTSDFYPEVPSHAVELQGSKVIHVTADSLTTPIADAVSGTASVRKAWWLAHNKALNDPKIDQATIVAAVATVKDDAGADVNLVTYPQELLKPLPKWVKTQFGINVIHAHVRAEIAYLRWADTGFLIPDTSKTAHFVTHSVKLTNATTRTYTAIKTSDPGETPPAGVAESVYRSMALALNAGSITFTNAQLRSDIYIGCRLKLIGPTTTFVNILPQAIRARPHFGETTVQFGPSAIVDAAAEIELARATRWRFVYNMPSGRSDGMGSGSEQDDETMDSPSENSGFGDGGEKLAATTFVQVP